MDFHIKNKMAVVTGGSNGIGRAISLTLAREGAVVIINYHRDADAAEQTLNEIKAMGEKASAVRADISDFDQAKQMFRQIKHDFSRIDILVNNAGILKDNLLMKMTEPEWHAVLGTNLTGVFNCSKAAIIGMMRQKSGRIINISSISGLVGLPGQANYSAAKGGVNAFTRALAKEVASLGITVNAVAPGFIETKMTDRLTETQKKEEKEKIPMGRFGTPREVANMVLFLASDLASYMTGQIISIDGGLHG